MVAWNRAFAMVVAAALLVTLFPAAVPQESASGTLSIVNGPGAAAALASVGVRALDDYGPFATALVPDAAAAALRADGLVVTPLPTTTGRGAYRFDATLGVDGVPAAWRSDDSPYSLIAFRGPVKQAWRDALLREASIYDYLPYNSFIVRGDRAALAGLEGVEFVGAYHAGYKVEPSLRDAPGALRVSVFTFPDADLAAAQQAIAATGARVLDVGFVPGLEGIVKVETDADHLRALAAVDDVSWLEASVLDYSLDNEKATGLVQNGVATERVVSDQGVDGSSQVASICDTGVNTVGTGTTRTMQHDMYNDPVNPGVTFQQTNPLHRKVLLYYAPVENGQTKGDFAGEGHGTHTAGTIAGDIAPFGSAQLHDSGAYAAKLAICDVTNGGSFQFPLAYRVQWDPAYDVGARVNSNSWGGTHTNIYTDSARQHDAYVWEHRDFTILRSAGNTGPSGLIRPEAVAKDIITVGSSINDGSGNTENLAGGSTRGPAADGRIKPDLVAPGQCLQSANTNTNGYTCLSGTSMATPTAAAAALLVRDYFAKGFYPGGAAGSGPATSATNALVKAMLFASGDELSGTATHAGPYIPAVANAIGMATSQVSNTQAVAAALYGQVLSNSPQNALSTFPNGNVGWGRIRLDDALFFAGDARKLLAQDEGVALGTGDSASLTVHVADTAQPLRVMVVWSDAAGAAGANPALVNDLDLTVTDPAGNVVRGNAFLGHDSTVGGLPDGINTAEAFALSAPAAGDYTITVTGANVPAGPQPFALVVVGGL